MADVLNSDFQGVLAAFRNAPVVIAVVMVDRLRRDTTSLDDIGNWIELLWCRVESTFPCAQPIRLLWPMIAFVVPGTDINAISELLQLALVPPPGGGMRTLCAIDVSTGPPEAKLKHLDELGGEVCVFENLGSLPQSVRRFVNGVPWRHDTE